MLAMPTREADSALIPYYVKDGVYQFFLQLRDDKAPRYPNRIGFFGGGAEPGESPEDTVLRETYEELAIHVVPTFYKTYDKLDRVMHVFLLEVEEDFGGRVTILEGEDGMFLSETEIEENQLLVDVTRDVLRDVLHTLKG